MKVKPFNAKKAKKELDTFSQGPSDFETRFVKSVYLLRRANALISSLAETSRRAGMKQMHSDFVCHATSIGHIESRLSLPYGLSSAWGRKILRHLGKKLKKSTSSSNLKKDFARIKEELEQLNMNKKQRSAYMRELALDAWAKRTEKAKERAGKEDCTREQGSSGYRAEKSKKGLKSYPQLDLTYASEGYRIEMVVD